MRIRRVLMVVALVTWGLTPVSGSASELAQVEATDDLCDPGSVSQFTDVDAGDYGAEYILCMRALGLSVGTGGGSYGPETELSPRQLAAFVARLWRDVLDNTCPEGTDGDGTLNDNLSCLNGLGITQDSDGVSYESGGDVSASLLSRVLQRTHDNSDDSCDAASDDELGRALACLLSMRVIPSEAEAGGDGSVTRAQTAVYVIGLWHNMAGEGLPPTPPERPSTHGSGSTEEAALPRRPDHEGDDDDKDDNSTSTTQAGSTTIATDNDGTDSDGIDTTPYTDNDGTDSDGIDTTPYTDNDGTDTPETDPSTTSTVTTVSTSTTQGSSTTIATDDDGTDSDGYDTPETDSSTTSTVTTVTTSTTSTTQVTTTTIATDDDGTDSDGYDTPATPVSGSDSSDSDDSD